MAENPVLKEARRTGMIPPASASTENTKSAAAPSSSANPVIREFYGLTAQEREETQKQIVTQAKATAPSVPQQQEKQEDPGLLSRTGNTVTGAAKSSASSFANLGGVILEGLGKLGSFLQDKKDAKQAAQDREYLAQHEKELADALATGDEEAAKWAQIKINQAKYRLKTNGDLGDYYDSVTEDAVQDVYGKADDLAASAATDIEEAKKGLGGVGQFVVDTGVAGTQLAGDMGLALLTGGTALVPMAARSFGGAAQEARQSGAAFGQQVAYGAGSAALGALTEKIANVAGPFKKAFGSGVIDKLAPNLTNRLTKSTVGKLALSALSEGGEEFVEAVFQPVLQQATYNRDASFDLEQALYEAAIGAALGGAGAGVDVATGGETTQNPAGKAAGAQAVSSEGKFTPTKQTSVQAVSGGVLEQEAQRLYAKENPPAQGTGYAATDLGRPSAPLGVSATQKDNTSVAPSAGNASENVDPLLKLLTGGKRVDQSTLTNEQFDALADRADIGMDAKGRVFQMDPAQHIDLRRSDEMGNRKINAFQFDHPEIQPYYKEAAAALLDELSVAQKGGQLIKRGDYHTGEEYFRTKRGASERISSLLDDYGLSYAQIEKACNAIINDQGQENIAAAKRVEFVLDEMLSGGYQSMSGFIPANQNYLAAKAGIAGSQAGVEHESMIPDDLDAVPGDDGLGAANAGFDPYSHLQNQTDRFHPEGAYAARPVDVPTTNFEGRNIPKAASTIMGAQGIDESDVRFLEQQIADGKLAFDTIRDTDAVARAQTVMQEKGFDGAMEQYRQAVAGNVATKDNTALGQQLLLRAMREGNTAYVAELLTLYTRNSTTAAQAMQAQSIFRKLSPEGQLVAVQKAVADLNTKYGTDVQLSEEEVADFLNAETPEARQEVTERIVARAAESVPGTFRAKYDTLRYLAMLGNPRTHIRNILGNTFFQVPVAVKNRVGAVAEGIAHIASGGKTERTKALFGVNPLGKLAADARADWANAKDFLEQTSKYMEGQTSLWDIEQQADAFSNSNILGRGVNKAADMNSRALAAEDTAAKKWIYTQSLAGYLKANGCKSIADADLALLNRARNYAAQEALRGTFNDSNEISDAVSALGRASKSENKAVKAAGYVVEGVLPFKRTPANIAVRAVEYSPIGAVLGAVETMRGAKSGDMARVSVGLDRTAAGVSGTALLAAGFLAAGAGYVTGGEDEDEKQQAFDDLTGHQNYALELKDGTSVTLDWLAPEAIPFFMGVELHESMLDGGVSWDEAWETVKNAASPMLEMSMLQGLNDTFENAAYAKNRGDSVLGSLLTSALTNYATQIFPTLGGQIERSHEDVRMTTYTEKDGSLPTDFQYTLGKVSQKVPGWDYQQIPYIDAWGRTEATGDALERSINNLFNPAYVSQVDVDDLKAELQRLKDATGSASVFPERAERSITVDGEKKILTAEEYQQYATTLGQSSYALVKAGTSLAAYRAMNDAEKVEYVDRLYQYATQTAKASVSAYQTDTWVENARRAQSDIGVSTAEYIALYEKYGSNILSGAGYEKTKQAVAAGLTVEEYAAMKGGMDADDNGSVSQKEAQAYLDRQTFAVGVKADLWTIINKSWKNNPYA